MKKTALLLITAIILTACADSEKLIPEMTASIASETTTAEEVGEKPEKPSINTDLLNGFNGAETYTGRVGDLFLGMKGAVSVEEFNGVYAEMFDNRDALLTPRPGDWDDDSWSSGFRYNNGRIDFVVYVNHEKDDTISPDSVLQFINEGA